MPRKGKFTAEHKDKISKALYEYWKDPEHREVKSKLLKEYWKVHYLEHPLKGKKWTQEHKDNLSKALKQYYKEHPRPKKSKKPLLSRSERGQIIREYWQSHEHPLKRPEVVEKARQGRLKYYKEHSANNKDKPHSEETKRKISESCRKAGVGRWNRKKKKD